MKEVLITKYEASSVKECVSIVQNLLRDTEMDKRL
mgnify:CR=1 FL=1